MGSVDQMTEIPSPVPVSAMHNTLVIINVLATSSTLPTPE